MLRYNQTHATCLQSLHRACWCFGSEHKGCVTDTIPFSALMPRRESPVFEMSPPFLSLGFGRLTCKMRDE